MSFVSSLFYHAHNFFLDFILYSFLTPSKVISSQLNKWGYFIFNIHLFPRIFFIVLLRWRFNARNCFVEFCQIDWAFYAELIVLLYDFWWVFIETFSESFLPELLQKSDRFKRLDLKFFFCELFPKFCFRKNCHLSYHYKFIPNNFIESPFHQLLFSIIIKGSEKIISIKITISRIPFIFEYLQKRNDISRYQKFVGK